MGRGTPPRVSPVAAVAVVAALTCLVLCAPASALSPPTPWDGSNPFNCTIQDAGLGTTVPDPGADPYCVHFDKTNQNVAQLGIVQFLLEEPARTAAAVPKCFYFQEDHWRGSIAPGGAAIYNFEGHYFFNKATGDGGVWVTDFTLDGQTFDPTALPGFPPGYGQDFGPGTGGFITHDAIPADPSCAARADGSPHSIYAQAPRPRCVADRGWVTPRALGPVAIGARENAVRAAIGPPVLVKRGYLRYCVTGGGVLAVGQPGDRSGNFGTGGRAPAVILFATARGFRLRGRAGHTVGVGSTLRRLRLAFPRARPIARLGATRVLRLSRTVLLGERAARVRFLAVYDPRAIATPRALADFLVRAG